MSRRIAVLGASEDRTKYGNKCVRAYREAGWDVVPVNPKGGEIEGLAVSPDLASVPGEIDRVSVYLQPPLTRRLLPEIAAAGAETFFNPGSADGETLRNARELGIEVRDACSIVAIGLSPSQFP